MATARNSNTNLFEKTWVKVTGAITTAAGVFVLGYNVGCFKSDLNFKIEKLELKQEYDEKVQAEIDKYKNHIHEDDEKTVAELKTVVDKIAKGGHNEKK